MQFSVDACELCMLGCVLLNCNGTKWTGNALSISAAACSQQLLRETRFQQVAISLLVWSFHPMIWMYLWQISPKTMLWLTCRDYPVEFWSFFVRNCVKCEGIWSNVWLPYTVNMPYFVQDLHRFQIGFLKKSQFTAISPTICFIWWNATSHAVLWSCTWTMHGTLCAVGLQWHKMNRKCPDQPSSSLLTTAAEGNKLPTGCYFFACLVFSPHDMKLFVTD